MDRAFSAEIPFGGAIEAQLAQLEQEKAAARSWVQLQFVLPSEEQS